jgi:pimeloyl-ACP methyl ester carboxylesterase
MSSSSDDTVSPDDTVSSHDTLPSDVEVDLSHADLPSGGPALSGDRALSGGPAPSGDSTRSARPLPPGGTLRLGDHDVRISVEGEGPPLLLLNGVGAPLELWRPLLPRLSGFRTIAYDTPGSGGSVASAIPLSILGHARLALALLDALGCREAAALGFSFGGMVAQELARLAGSRITRLALVSTTCGWGGVPGDPAALFEISDPERYYSRPLFAAPAATVGTDGLVGSRTDGRVPVYPVNRRGYLYQLWAASTWSSLPWLGRIRQPTLVLTGDSDTVVPAMNARILASMIPSARLVVIRRGNHLCLFERRDETAPLLNDFLGPGRSRAESDVHAS